MLSWITEATTHNPIAATIAAGRGNQSLYTTGVQVAMTPIGGLSGARN